MSEGSHRGMIPSVDGIDSLIHDLEAEVLHLGIMNTPACESCTNNCTSHICYTF